MSVKDKIAMWNNMANSNNTSSLTSSNKAPVAPSVPQQNKPQTQTSQPIQQTSTSSNGKPNMWSGLVQTDGVLKPSQMKHLFGKSEAPPTNTPVISNPPAPKPAPKVASSNTTTASSIQNNNIALPPPQNVRN